MDPEQLRAIPAFATVSARDLRRIATFAAEDSAGAGTTLMREGDYANDMLAIESGTAQVLQGGAPIGTLGPGDVFGEIGLVRRELRTATVVATSPIRVVRLSLFDFKRLPEETRDGLVRVAEERLAHDPGGPVPEQ
jgi:CRP-like cAMP-binding protein